MRRPVTTVLLALCLLTGCTDDGSSSATTTTRGTASTTTTSIGDDPALRAKALTTADLPDGFQASSDVDDTITAFCANEDAAAGLRATAREVRGFTRAAGGASVVQLLFRFQDDGAAAFVAQAAGILERCSGVPDASGLAFEYAELGADLDALVAAGSDAHTGRRGTSVGSGNLTVAVVVLQQGDVGELVAVLGLSLPAPELDALAQAAFAAAVAKP